MTLHLVVEPMEKYCWVWNWRLSWTNCRLEDIRYGKQLQKLDSVRREDSLFICGRCCFLTSSVILTLPLLIEAPLSPSRRLLFRVLILLYKVWLTRANMYSVTSGSATKSANSVKTAAPTSTFSTSSCTMFWALVHCACPQVV